MENPELKSIISEIKNSLDELNSRLVMGQWTWRQREIIKSADEKKRKKKLHLSDLLDNIKKSNVKLEEKENGTGKKWWKKNISSQDSISSENILQKKDRIKTFAE